jgi:hypothetical protein
LACCFYCTPHNKNIHAPGGMRARNPSNWAATHLRLTPHGHWNRQIQFVLHSKHRWFPL